MTALIAQLLATFAPIVTEIIAHHQAANNGAMPTTQEITDAFEANIDKYLGEGSAWRLAHPTA